MNSTMTLSDLTALTGLDVATHTRPEDLARLAPWARLWETWVSSAFRQAYLAATDGTALVPRDPDGFDTLLRDGETATTAVSKCSFKFRPTFAAAGSCRARPLVPRY